MPEDTITIQQAMSILHRSEKQVRRHIKTGRLQGDIGRDGKYYLSRSEVEAMARHPARMQEDKIARRISSLERRIDEIEKRLGSLSTHVDEMREALYSMAEPQIAQPLSTPRSEQAKPSVPQPVAIVELPADSIHIQDFLSLHHLKNHRRKIIGYMDAPRNGLKFHAVPKQNRAGETDRYLDPLQQDTLLAWLHVHHAEIFEPEGSSD